MKLFNVPLRSFNDHILPLPFAADFEDMKKVRIFSYTLARQDSTFDLITPRKSVLKALDFPYPNPNPNPKLFKKFYIAYI